jgi:hypothetical protein
VIKIGSIILNIMPSRRTKHSRTRKSRVRKQRKSHKKRSVRGSTHSARRTSNVNKKMFEIFRKKIKNVINS